LIFFANELDEHQMCKSKVFHLQLRGENIHNGGEMAYSGVKLYNRFHKKM